MGCLLPLVTDYCLCLSLFLNDFVGYSLRTSMSPRALQGHLTAGVRNLRTSLLCVSKSEASQNLTQSDCQIPATRPQARKGADTFPYLPLVPLIGLVTETAATEPVSSRAS